MEIHKQIKNLKKLDRNTQILFANLVSEFQFPFYVKFEEKYQYGSSEKLRSVIDEIYVVVNTYNLIADQDIEDLENVVDSISPDTNDFGGLLGSLALNAASSVTETLRMLREEETDQLRNIISLYFDSFDFYYSGLNVDDEERKRSINNASDALNELIEMLLKNKEYTIKELIDCFCSNQLDLAILDEEIL